MTGHATEVHSLCAWRGLLFSGDWGGSIRAWDQRGKCVLVLERAHGNAVTCMKVWQDKLFTASYDNTIAMWKWQE